MSKQERKLDPQTIRQQRERLGADWDAMELHRMRQLFADYAGPDAIDAAELVRRYRSEFQQRGVDMLGQLFRQKWALDDQEAAQQSRHEKMERRLARLIAMNPSELSAMAKSSNLSLAKFIAALLAPPASPNRHAVAAGLTWPQARRFGLEAEYRHHKNLPPRP